MVEIDESKFRKRKYNTGRLVEGQWVVGGICVFLAVCPDNKRYAETLLEIIERHVEKNSTVVTDCWRAYEQLDRDGWNHLTVNHSYNFVGMHK